MATAQGSHRNAAGGDGASPTKVTIDQIEAPAQIAVDNKRTGGSADPTGGATTMTTTAAQSEHATTGEPISPAQRRALFAAGSNRGLDIDDLRSLTPAGSISAMTHAEASRLLDHLNAHTKYEHTHRTPRRPKGVYRIASEPPTQEDRSIASRSRLDRRRASRMAVRAPPRRRTADDID